MFQMQYLQVSFEAACFSQHFDTSFKKGTVSVAVYAYRTHWFRRRIRLYNQNEAYNSVAVYGYGTNSPWNGSVAVQNRPLLMYESSQSIICAGELRIFKKNKTKQNQKKKKKKKTEKNI